jgi:hypothetical protein
MALSIAQTVVFRDRMTNGYQSGYNVYEETVA